MLMESRTLQQSTSYTRGTENIKKMNNAFLVKAEKYLDATRILHQQLKIHTPMDEAAHEKTHTDNFLGSR
jgi:hypothetical protein